MGKQQTIADTLRRAIRQSGKTVYRVSQESGVSQGVIARFLRAERDIRLETLEKLAPVVGVSVRAR